MIILRNKYYSENSTNNSNAALVGGTAVGGLLAFPTYKLTEGEIIRRGTQKINERVNNMQIKGEEKIQDIKNKGSVVDRIRDKFTKGSGEDRGFFKKIKNAIVENKRDKREIEGIREMPEKFRKRALERITRKGNKWGKIAGAATIAAGIGSGLYLKNRHSPQ